MGTGLIVDKYQVVAAFRGGVVEWHFAVQTEDGRSHEVAVRDGEEIPVLLDIVRKDATVRYDPQTCSLSTGWNKLGS